MKEKRKNFVEEKGNFNWIAILNEYVFRHVSRYLIKFTISF